MSQTDGPRTSSRWPTGTEYAASVQQPATSFADPELQRGALTLTPLGIPASASGQNAIAFHMRATDRAVAVRCLLSANDDGRLRYRALREHVEAFDIPGVVSANWLDEGVRVHGRWWPVVVMPWVAGDPLHVAIEDRLNDPGRLMRLADRWLDLVEILQDKEFAHGDYQHGNVLLDDDDTFRLVDLDGIWVPDMGVGPPNEYGHPNYQHINRSDTDWGPYVDTFSALVIALSMLALAHDPSLARFMTGENLLFAKSDFEDPGSSEVWRTLAGADHPEVQDLAARLHAFAQAGRPPAMSVREVLDASFDPSALLSSTDPGTGPDPGVPLPRTTAVDDNAWWGSTPAAPPPAPAPAPAPAPTAPTPTTPSAPPPSSVPADHSGPHAPQPRPFVAAVPPAAGRPTIDPNTSTPSEPSGASAAAVVPARATGLARITGQPVLAGLISGALAGLVGSLLAGILQAFASDPRLDGGIFVGMIAGTLGGAVHAWSALNLSNYGLAVRRFLIGAAVGLVAGIVAVFVADFMTRSTLDVRDTQNAVLVAYIWALTAALVGLAVGLLRSPKAGAYAFSGGAVAGFAGGMVHGLTSATFDDRALQVNGFDPQVLLIASFVAMLIGGLVAVAIRTARNGSLTVVEGPGRGTVIDFHSNRVSIGGSDSDTLVVTGRDLRGHAVRLDVGERVATATAQVAVSVDGAAQPERFVLGSGQIMAVAGMFVRLDIKSGSGQGGS